MINRDIMSTDVVLMAMTVALLWGVAPVVHKYVLHGRVSEKIILVVGGVAYFIVLMMYWVVHAPEIQHGFKTIRWLDIILISIASVFMNLFAKIIYLNALKHAESYVISSLVYSAPLFTLLFAVLLLHEQVTLWKLVGVCMIVGGITLVSF